MGKRKRESELEKGWICRFHPLALSLHLGVENHRINLTEHRELTIKCQVDPHQEDGLV